MAGKFELYKDKRGEYRFRLKASNGQVIATGEGYKAKAGCLNGIESVKKNCAGENFEVYEDKRGEHRFRLKATNGQIIATGEGYTSKAGCDNGIASIRKNAPTASTVEAD